jgi:hypothetical protein
MSLSTTQLPRSAQAIELAQVASYQATRGAWSRSDSERWLDDRSEALVAWLRRKEPAFTHLHSRRAGRWLRSNRKAFFDRAHLKLAACETDEAAREKFTLWNLL